MCGCVSVIIGFGECGSISQIYGIGDYGMFSESEDVLGMPFGTWFFSFVSWRRHVS